MRRLAAVIGLVLTAAVLWWVWASDAGPHVPEPPAPAVAKKGPPPAATERERLPRPELAPPDTAAGSASDADPAKSDQARSEPGDGPIEVTPIHVTGSAHFTDDDEPLRRFEFRFWDDDESIRRDPRALALRTGTRVHGTDGHFRAVFPAPGRYTISLVKAVGVEHDTVSGSIDVEPGKELRIAVVRSPMARIRVIDEQTREPIPGARVYAARDRVTAPPWRAYPGTATQRGTPLWTDEDGSVDLGRGLEARRWFVVADGYAWRLATICPDAKLSHMVVSLDRGGTLELTVERFEELEDPQVYTVRETDAQDTELPLPDVYGRAAYPGLRPGRHRVTIYRGRSSSGGIVFATGQVTVEPGQVAQLRLQADPGEKRTLARATVTVSVPESWGDLPTELWIRGTRPETAEVDVRTRLRDLWDGRTATLTTDELPIGEYAIEVSPYQWRRAAVIDAEARLQVQLGEPAVVRVLVLDDATGELIPDASVMFMTEMDGLDSWNATWADRSSDGRAWTLRAGAGTLAIHVHASGYIDPEEDGCHDLELRAGESREHTIRLRRGGTIHVDLQLDGDPFHVVGATIDLKPVGHSDDTSWSTSGGRRGLQHVEFSGLADGTYELTLTGMTGFEPVAARTVTVLAGETSRVTIDLRRLR